VTLIGGFSSLICIKRFGPFQGKIMLQMSLTFDVLKTVLPPSDQREQRS
jgi:hypothetical protein